MPVEPGATGLPAGFVDKGGGPVGLGGSRDGLPADGRPGGIPAGLGPAWFAMMKAVSASAAW